MLKNRMFFAAGAPAAADVGVEPGTLWSWGFNASGRTGQGTVSDTTITPTQIGSDTDWTIVSSGLVNALALKTDKTLWAWGANVNGVTGQGTDTGNTTIPTQIQSDADWIYIAIAPSSPAFAIKEDHTLWAWGLNAGNATAQGIVTGTTFFPSQIQTDADWVYVTAGDGGGLAIKENGTLWSWGSNFAGKSGQGTTLGSTATPTQVGTDSDWLRVSSNQTHTLAIKENGTIWGWGANDNSRTGLGTTAGNTLVPTQIGSDTDWIDIVTGFSQGFAMKEDGTLWSWGGNNSFTTAQGISSGETLVPTQVGSDTDWKSVTRSNSNEHQFAVKNNNALFSWGFNIWYKTAQGTDSGTTASPTQVSGPLNWLQAFAIDAASIGKRKL